MGRSGLLYGTAGHAFDPDHPSFRRGTVVLLPYSVIGFFMVYYMDYITLHTMLSVWGAVAWSLGGLFTGLAADGNQAEITRRGVAGLYVNLYEDFLRG
jgi:hypothetical protein